MIGTLGHVIRTLWWRIRCPRTVEAAARDFLRNRMTPTGIGWVHELSEPEIMSAKTLDQRRRIAYIYGLAKDGSWARDWNCRLLEASGAQGAEGAAAVIFREVWRATRPRGGRSS
jgi:hypothetical protein